MAKNQNNNVAPATQKTEPGAKKDALATALAQIEKQFGKGAIMKLGDNTAMQVDAISTGSLGLDLALGVGGVPRGRIIEVFGPESSGKTTLALHILAEAQKKGGEVAFIDVEHALDPAYASALGVNIDELLVSQPDTGEQAMEICEALVRSGAIDAIVVDSVAAMVPRAEIEGEMGDSHVGLQARLMSQAMRKLTSVIGTPAHYAYLKIAEGCNNRCHYCAIPGIRGPLRSREMADCVAEARWLAGEGVKELIIVAQDPTAYGEDWGKPGSICELLDKLNKIPGLEWIRIMYAYPERITDDFIAAMKRNEKVLPYLDLPIQHCNDTILKNMNRRSNRAELLDVIGKLRREIPNITLRTTLIAGFPGETEEQFEDLCNFVKEVQFDRLGCFAYSAEENTVAARMDGQIDQEVKDKRAELVMQIQTGIMAQKQAAKVGQTVRVLCDGVDDESGLYLCRTAADAPEVDGNVCVSSEEPLYPGEFYDVLVDDSDLYDLYGTVAK